MKLKAATRNAMPASKFGMPGSRHAANAKSRATQMVKRGKLSPAMASKIRTKANKILGGSSAAAAY